MFLDANIFIYAFDLKEGDKKIACQKLLRSIILRTTNAHTSVLVLNEVHYFFLNSQNAKRANAIIKNILTYRNLTILPLDKELFFLIAQYTQDGLQTTDAFHVASMKLNSISTICSYDKGFDSIKTIKRQVPK
jgi:predicted nucleic acid-binding protein